MAKPKSSASKQVQGGGFIGARISIINFGKYKLVMFVMVKIMEMESTEQNKVALYLFNNI